MAKSFEISRVFKGILIALVLSLLFNILLSVIYHFTSIQSSIVHSFITAGVSVILASFFVCFQFGSKGLIYGLFIGLGFFLASLLLYYTFYEGNPSVLIILEKALVSLVAGALGGTIGAILKRS